VTYSPPAPSPAPTPPPQFSPSIRALPTGTTLTADPNIQGNVLAAFSKDFAAFLFVELQDL
jgi:hypothetical protein